MNGKTKNNIYVTWHSPSSTVFVESTWMMDFSRRPLFVFGQIQGWPNQMLISGTILVVNHFDLTIQSNGWPPSHHSLHQILHFIKGCKMFRNLIQSKKILEKNSWKRFRFVYRSNSKSNGSIKKIWAQLFCKNCQIDYHYLRKYS